jgi:beta-mannosidase
MEIPATVPGCVHTDLLAAGVIPDPFVNDNEVRLHWIGRTTWQYETSFDAPPHERGRLDLVCAGLDTIATVTLNDTELGRTENMHRGYRFDTAGALRPGRNTLRVRFDSAYAYANEMAQRLGPRPAAYTEPYNFIRKMACNFGWDWGPTVVTAGIWQPIGLDHWSVARLDEVRPLVTVVRDEETGSRDGVVEVHARLQRQPEAADRAVDLVATIAGHHHRVRVEPGSATATLRLRVPSPALWWPRGYGEPVRYPLEVALRTGDGTELECWRRSVGFRDVRLDTGPDEHGSAYTLLVNDVPVFVRGANWIPDDPFPSRITRDRLAQRLEQAAEANLNLLRVWGGGRYESEDFYELADSAGIMVGQDFLFACAAYPEEEPFAAEVAAEAREQVVRLASHPSLVWWTGNNENIWGFADWNWREPLAGRSWGAGYYHEVLPRLVAELDPTRPYWPGSPYSGRPDLHPNDAAHGTMHIWDVWNTDDYTRYRHYRPRFVAEFGYQGPAAYATLSRVIDDAPLASDSPGMRHHQKAADGDLKLARGLAAHLPPPRDFDDWHYLTQVNQARAVQLGVEHFRALTPLCMGATVWQLNDCWPVTSWSAVDGDGRRKPLWYALRRAFADRLLTVQPSDDGLRLAVVNDGPEHWSTLLDVSRVSLDGEPRAKTTLAVDVAPRAILTIPLPADLATPDDPRGEVLVVDDPAADLRAWWFFAEDKDIAYPAAGLDAVVEPVDGGQLVTVTARTLLRDLCLFPDRLDPTATVDEMLVNLLPGESAAFTVRAGPAHSGRGPALDPVALTTPPVLRCVNDIPGR